MSLSLLPQGSGYTSCKVLEGRNQTVSSTYHSAWHIARSEKKYCDSVGKESAHSAGDLGSIPGLGRAPGDEKGYSLQYFGLENSMDCIIPGVPKSQTQLSDFHFHIYYLDPTNT